jgi:hypothetical protein
LVEIVSNLLKLTDYPFAYSLAGLILFINGHGASFFKAESYGPLFLIMGIVGTSLAITDPLGRLIQFILNVFAVRNQTGKKSYYSRRATKTEWITYEINKLVSTIYFFILLSFFIYFWFNSPLPTVLCNTFAADSNLVKRIVFTTDSISSSSCLIHIPALLYFVIATDLGLSIIIFLSSRKLLTNTRLVAEYFSSKKDLDELEREINTFFDQKRREFYRHAESIYKSALGESPNITMVSPGEVELRERSETNRANSEQLQRSEDALRTREQEMKASLADIENDCKDTVSYFNQREWTLAGIVLESIKDSIDWLKKVKMQ